MPWTVAVPRENEQGSPAAFLAQAAILACLKASSLGGIPDWDSADGVAADWLLSLFCARAAGASATNARKAAIKTILDFIRSSLRAPDHEIEDHLALFIET